MKYMIILVDGNEHDFSNFKKKKKKRELSNSLISESRKLSQEVLKSLSIKEKLTLG